MILKVNVRWPKDRLALENKVTKVMADILIKKLQPTEVDQLIEILNDKSLNIGL